MEQPDYDSTDVDYVMTLLGGGLITEEEADDLMEYIEEYDTFIEPMDLS